jgi:hypothetical protein
MIKTGTGAGVIHSYPVTTWVAKPASAWKLQLVDELCMRQVRFSTYAHQMKCNALSGCCSLFRSDNLSICSKPFTLLRLHGANAMNSKNTEQVESRATIDNFFNNAPKAKP